MAGSNPEQTRLLGFAAPSPSPLTSDAQKNAKEQLGEEFSASS
jgi:hypothetical protein